MPISAADVIAIHELADRAASVDGVSPLSQSSLLALPRAVLDASPAARTPTAHLTFDPTVEGQPRTLVATAVVLEDGSAELVVDPGHRRLGLGTQLLSRVLDSPVAVRVWAHGDLPAAAALAKSAGLQQVRTLMQLARLVNAVPGITELVVPQGFSLTSFETDRDAEDWLALNRIAFDYHPEQGRVSRADLEELIEQDWFDPLGLLLLRSDADGALAASHWTKIPTGQRAEGEVYVVAVDPAFQGHGLGRFITAAGLAHLAQRGVDRITLYVEGDNAAALATYRGLGFAPAATDVQYAVKEHAPRR